MNKNDFLKILEKNLDKLKITDIKDIILEYENHFNFKLADGFSEEEIAEKLGNPEELAKQFTTTTPIMHHKNKILLLIGLAFIDIFVMMLFVLLYSLVIGIISFGFTALTICIFLILNNNSFQLIPPLPYICALVNAPAFLALSTLSFISIIYLFLFNQQLWRAFKRWQKNVLAKGSKKPVYPPLSMHPQINPKLKRYLRSVALISVIIFAISLIIGYVFCVISAGAFEYWHAWNWFI